MSTIASYLLVQALPRPHHRANPSFDAHSGSNAALKARKTSSITIRLTADEQIQLHAREAEAGLTVSAYLRSCVFEAESLRAQVKEALFQIRGAASQDARTSQQSKPPTTWRARFLPRCIAS